MFSMFPLVCAVAAATKNDLQLLLKNFPGEYDNYAQWEADVENNVSVAALHGHLHSIFFGPVNLPAFGENVFYVQQYMDGVPTQIYRQRLYNFAANSTGGSIATLSFFDFKDGSKYINAQKDPTKLQGLTRADTTQVTDKCNVHIHRQGDRFVGSTTKDCIVTDHRTGTPILIKDNNEFGANFVSIHERGFDAKTGTPLFGNLLPDVLNRTRAARRFTGYVATESDGKWGLMSNVSVWDVGQMVPIVTDDGIATKFSVEIAYCTYLNGANVLKIAIHEKGFTWDGKVLPPAYAWTLPESTQVGINLRYIQAGFNLVE